MVVFGSIGPEGAGAEVVGKMVVIIVDGDDVPEGSRIGAGAGGSPGLLSGGPPTTRPTASRSLLLNMGQFLTG